MPPMTEINTTKRNKPPKIEKLDNNHTIFEKKIAPIVPQISIKPSNKPKDFNSSRESFLNIYKSPLKFDFIEKIQVQKH